MPPQLSNQLATLAQNAEESVLAYTRGMMQTMVGYKELRMMYLCVLKEVRTKFDVLNAEFNVRYSRNPINSISMRVKSNASVMEKLERKGLPFSLANMETHIADMAGIRVVCSYVDDIYHLADSFIAQDDVTVLSLKDYIKNPKPNGYRSLHIIVSIPVFFCEKKKDIKVEVQLRTIAMDFWASLEHQIKYKQNIPDQQAVVARLKDCAETIMSVETEMLDLRQHLEELADVPTEDDILLEQLMRLDRPME